MLDISDFDKDQLAEYANNVFQVSLDLRKSRDRLISEVKALQDKPKAEEQEAVKLPANATHIKNAGTGLFFPWTPELAKHLGAAGIPCDEFGTQV